MPGEGSCVFRERDWEKGVQRLPNQRIWLEEEGTVASLNVSLSPSKLGSRDQSQQGQLQTLDSIMKPRLSLILTVLVPAASRGWVNTWRSHPTIHNPPSPTLYTAVLLPLPPLWQYHWNINSH